MHGAPVPDPGSIIVPEIMCAPSYSGQISFEQSCASCNGKNGAGGTSNGPPLVHLVYETGHHPDGSFQRAAASGVP